MNENQPMWSRFEGGEPLRCEICGEQIGKSYGEMTPAMREKIVVRCYACAATEEAEAITSEATE